MKKLLNEIKKILIVFLLLFHSLTPMSAYSLETTSSSLPRSSEESPVRDTSETKNEVGRGKLEVEVKEAVNVSFPLKEPLQHFTLVLPKGLKLDSEKMDPMYSLSTTSEGKYNILSTKSISTLTVPISAEEIGKYTAELYSDDHLVGVTDITVNDTDSSTVEGNVVPSDENSSSSSERTTAKEEDQQTDQSQQESPQDSESEVKSEKKQELKSSADSTTDDTSTEKDEVKNVSNWQELIATISDAKVKKINVIADFEIPDNPKEGIEDFVGGGTGASNPNGGTTYIYLNSSNISRTLVIEGNGHQIDFRAVSLCFRNRTVNSESDWNITLSNLQIYHGNYYGPVTYNDLSSTNQANSIINYQNVTNIGNQLIHAPRAQVILSGNTSSNEVPEYTSKFRTQRINATNQTNIEVSKLTIADNANVHLSTIAAGNIDLGGALAGDLKIGKNASLSAIANGAGGEADGTNLLIRSGKVVIDDSAKVSLVPQKDYSAISLRSTGADLIIGKKSSIKIASKGNTSTGNNRTTNLVWIAGGSKLRVGEGGQLKIDATQQQTSSSNIVQVEGDAQFIVEKDGELDIRSDSQSSSQSLLNFTSGKSTFIFADAQRINLQKTADTPDAMDGLIRIAGSTGTMQVDVQKVSLWKKGNLKPLPDFSWEPIFGLTVRYSGVDSSITSVSSIDDKILASFKEHFTTKNVQRVLFEKIPDVDVTIDSLSNNEHLDNFHVITGKASPNSLIRFKGDPAIPEGTIPSPNTQDKTPYHAKTNEAGEYRYELPKGKFFSKGSIVEAYAFLNGKSNTAQTKIISAIPPKDPLDPSNEVDPINRPELPEKQLLLSIDFISQFDFGKQKISAQDEIYFANPQKIKTESDGTGEENRPNYVQISDRRTENNIGWELSVEQLTQFHSEDDSELSGAQISFQNQRVISDSENDSSPSIPDKEKIDLVPGNKQILLDAKDCGNGTWIYRLGDKDTAAKSVSLFVPKSANPLAKQYKTSLFWELSSTPPNN
jgi:hypothetical protein